MTKTALRLSPLVLYTVLLACKREPYFEGTGPVLAEAPLSPAWENGNLGTAIRLPDGADARELTEEQRDALDDFIVTVSGQFGDCAQPSVLFGGKHATIVDVTEQSIELLTPPGPVRGGLVEVQVACEGGVTAVADAYDYILGRVDEDGEARRLEPLFENEYASFAAFYYAQPFLNWPEPSGYGFFFSQPVERGAAYFGQNPDSYYGGRDADTVEEDWAPVPAQRPSVEFDSPEQGSRLNGGDSITFFRERKTEDPLNEPLTKAARKRESTFQPGNPDLHSDTNPNNQSAWLVVPFETDQGVPAKRYYRLGQAVGRWCAVEREGCGGSDDDALNRTRLEVDNTWNWSTPETPSDDDLVAYADEHAEHLAWQTCIADGGDEATCANEALIALPSGEYNNVQVCRSMDEAGNWPWLVDLPGGDDVGFCRVLETIPSLEISTGTNYVDVPERAVGIWAFDDENRYYDGFATIGENVWMMDERVWISYEGGFVEGHAIPGKNTEMVIPEDAPEIGSAEYDATPFLRTPTVSLGTFLGNDSDFATKFGFPATVPTDGSESWSFAIPADITGGGWDDTYVQVNLEVIDLDVGASGLGNRTVWRASAWGWADDGFVTFPKETLATLPKVANAFRPDTEQQEGDNLIGFVQMEIHRIASWALGEGATNPDGRVVFDVSAVTQYYFQTVASCTDGLDNDADGLCDAGDCIDPVTGARLDADPSCDADGDGEVDEGAEFEAGPCQDGDDNDDDGLIDFGPGGDPDCDSPTDLVEGAACGDEVDNDGDGWVDADDSGCSGGSDADEGGLDYLGDCSNGIDDDGDGFADGLDLGCEAGADMTETGDGDTCNDGLDNNEDGWIDALDIACDPHFDFDGDGIPNNDEDDAYAAGDVASFPCANVQFQPGQGYIPLDDDGDGLANAADPVCAFAAAPSEEEAPVGCEDRSDDDGDGWIDELDPGCGPALNTDEDDSAPGAGTCNDGTDNDADGWDDALDPDCADGFGDEGAATTPLECNDGVDNDGDGETDGDDGDCPTGKDDHESP